MTILPKELARRLLSPGMRIALRRVLRWDKPAVGQVDFGDFNRPGPISRYFGYDRGKPIDRHYVESLLSRHAAAIRGRVLEVGDDCYCRQFGSNIAVQDILHVDPACRAATIIGDLSVPGTLPRGAFDCLVVISTLDLIFDLRAAIAELYAGLRPGGTLLATLPGVCQVQRDPSGPSYWSFTHHAARRLFGEVFGPENVEVTSYGNAYAATAFLQGLALEDIEHTWLDRYDPAYPVVIGIKAVRPSEG